MGGAQDKVRNGGRRRSGMATFGREIFAQHLGISGDGSFEQELHFVRYPDNTFPKISLRFVQPISGNWSIWTGYRLEHNSESVVPDSVQTTSWITLNLS
ncbi:MAG: hypothetical protein L0I62_05435 [Gammaproteobacteria bacterium]|nr:hypothetical protein [Gammaproteobacteria bacterium]